TQRPLSRASTTSLHSVATQDHSNEYMPQYHHGLPPSQHMAHLAHGQMQYATQDQGMLQSSLTHADGMMLDSLHTYATQHATQQMMPQHSQTHHFQQQATNAYMQQLQNSEYSGSVPPPGVNSGAETDEKKKKSSSTSATNDKELREMLTRADGRSLKNVAEEVLKTERTSRAEKSKQLFAMLWLRQTCKHAKTSVPRNRVYSNYADRCATERVQPLNPASFGKLVRVIFPGIATRRLGVRGESKYHYVDLALVDDPIDGDGPERTGSAHSADLNGLRPGSANVSLDFNNMPRLPADTAVFPTQEHTAETPPAPQATGSTSRGNTFAQPNVPGYGSNTQASTMYEQELKFPPPDQDAFQENDSIELPNIHDYVPPKTDVDAANALTALYRTHCTSLVDCIRFCKEKQFWRLFTSFHGTLTVPVQKLLAHPDMAPWIRECDWLMYQKMIRFVSKLTLQVTPPIVLGFLNNISRELHGHISKTFQGHPNHVREARLEPATLFAQLLHRMLRANQAAHAAAALLLLDQNRNQMWTDWVVLVNPKRVMESELPAGCNMEEVYSILTQDVRSLLLPLSTPVWLENGTHYQEAALFPAKQHGDSPITNETVIDRLAHFLSNLATRFPNASTRTLLHCISALGTAACREITVENGMSFSPWWITKVFVDELSLWLASLGGFLDHKIPERKRETPSEASTVSPVIGAGGEQNGGRALSNEEDTRFSSLGADFGMDTSFLS
ncbi:hypothetical protein K490DRAFT_17288, partial [Saccharata proteae CBS 121410]